MMAKHSEFNVLAFGVFGFLAQPSVSTSNVTLQPSRAGLLPYRYPFSR